MNAPTIGTQYIDHNKRVCTVTDIWQTYNSAGELVQTRYVCSHEFMGQTVTERDVLAITIQRSIESERIHAENLARVSSNAYRRAEKSVGRHEKAIRRNINN